MNIGLRVDDAATSAHRDSPPQVFRARAMTPPGFFIIIQLTKVLWPKRWPRAIKATPDPRAPRSQDRIRARSVAHHKQRARHPCPLAAVQHGQNPPRHCIVVIVRQRAVKEEPARCHGRSHQWAQASASTTSSSRAGSPSAMT